MKKLAALLMVLMLVLCSAAQAESEVVIDLSIFSSDVVFPGENCYAVEIDGHIEIMVYGDVVLTGSTDKQVKIWYKSGEITLRNVEIEAKMVEENSLTFGMEIIRNDLEPASLSLMSEEEETKAPLVMNLEGMNRINFGMEGDNYGLLCAPALTLRGSGSLHTSLLTSGVQRRSGLKEKGDIVVEGGDIVVSNSILSETDGAAILTLDGSLTVKGGSVIAYNPICAYLNGDSETEGTAPGKVSAADDYVILAGEDVDSAQIVGEYKGEEYLEITKLVEPEITPSIPETGDGANLVLWTLMLAASVIGVLSMRRKAY